MALRRRSQSQVANAIWPGFVDAMTAMLLVFTFVLSVFMITQYFLRDTILGQEEQITDKDAALSQLSQRLDSLSDMLSLEQSERSAAEEQATRLQASLADLAQRNSTTESILDQVSGQLATAEEQLDIERARAQRAEAERKAFEALTESLRADMTAVEARLEKAESDLTEEERRRSAEAAAAQALRERLENAQTELTAMELSLEDRRAEAERTLILLAAAESAKSELAENLASRQAEIEGRDALLAAARTRLADFEAGTLEEQKQVALLNEQTRALRAQLTALSERLVQTEAERANLETSSEQQAAEIESLGSRLNTALAERNAALEEAKRVLEEQVDELSQFRSEFFGRVRAAIADRDGIETVGDRFVFQSEILFEPGSADLNEAGQRELGKFARILNDLASDLPPDVNWILRIDGHTDKRALVPGRTPYRNNWELSQARALSVAEYLMTDYGVPPERLAPTGFGEYQPVASGDTRAAYAQNRRIELKLTER